MTSLAQWPHCLEQLMPYVEFLHANYFKKSQLTMLMVNRSTPKNYICFYEFLTASLYLQFEQRRKKDFTYTILLDRRCICFYYVLVEFITDTHINIKILKNRNIYVCIKVLKNRTQDIIFFNYE